MKHLLLSLLSLFTTTLFAQHISGLYSGTLVNDSTKKIQSYELALSEYRNNITGYSYTTFVVNDTFYYSIKRVKASRQNGHLVVEDVKMLANNFPESPAKKVRQTNVIPLDAKMDTLSQIAGKWSTNQTKIYYSLHGNVNMKRDNDSAHSSLMSHLQELKIVEPDEYKDVVAKAAPTEKPKNIKEKPVKEPMPSKPVAAATVTPKAEIKEVAKSPEKPAAVAPVTVIAPEQRNVAVIENLSVSSDSLILSFYDNGVIDGDTISVYLNGQNIISKSKLTATAAKKVVYTNDQNITDYKLTLVAENLGTIPPNTGLMIIQDGDKKYQIRFSADMQNNAAIIIKRQRNP